MIFCKLAYHSLSKNRCSFSSENAILVLAPANPAKLDTVLAVGCENFLKRRFAAFIGKIICY